VIVTSLGYRTDLALRELEGSEVAQYNDCVVVRSPANPAFRWGNFILLREPPQLGEAQGWIARFHREFPDVDYVALGIDGTEAREASADEFLAAGFSRHIDSAAAFALGDLAARTLVMVADPADNAIGLYRSLGFADREHQARLERLAAEPPPR
jgi:hypothetical protein